MDCSRAIILAGAAFALSACASSAADRDRNGPIRALLSAEVLMLVSFDSDDDLNVSGGEIDAGLTREFSRADVNRDGRLTPIEFQNWSNLVLGGSQMGPFRLDFDRNVDNSITREEFDSEIRARVRAYDADESGGLARAEFVRLVGQARPPAERRLQPAPAIGPGGRN